MPALKNHLFGCGRHAFAALGLFVALSVARAAPGTVYLVVGSDTAIWNAITTVDVYTRHPHYLQASFTDTNAPSYQVMDPAWRAQFKDSFGQPIKFTWWVMGGNIYREADNLNVPLANTMTLHLMQKYHGDAIRRFGDELSLHYHTYLWSDYNGSGVYYWNQTRTFNECRADFDLTLAQYLLEEGVFPASFRSGWHFMDQDWQQYLNQLIPYCFHDNYPANVPWYTNAGPIAGVEDWSRAPSAFVPFQPSTNDYQVPGEGSGWNVRSVKTQALTQSLVDQMFSQASNGVDQVACFWDHLPENFVTNILTLKAFLASAAANNPAVPFRYCTAVEAMQRWRGLPSEPPQLDVSEMLQGQTVTLTITSSVPIFQPRPFVCLRDAFHEYTNITAQCVVSGANTWTIQLPVQRDALAKVAVAVTDLAGNIATRYLHYLPDDLYLDDLDPQYREEQGTWSSTTNSAWGTDARVALLSSNSTARADWFLPLSWSGHYHISAQIPSILDRATNVGFYVFAGSSNILTVVFPAGLPTNQWVFVASTVLDQTISNHVEMVVNGAGQPGTYALSDVLRVEPVAPMDLGEPNLQDTVLIVPTTTGFLLRFSGQAGHNYTVQRTSNLAGEWTTLQVLTPAASTVLEYQDENPLPVQAFYRIQPQ